MWKIISILLLTAILTSGLTACGQPAAKTNNSAAQTVPEVVQLNAEGYHNIFNGKTMAVIYQNLDEVILEDSVNELFKNKFDFDFQSNIVYVDSLTDGLLMLRSGKADALQVMRFTGDYLLQRNSDLKMYVNDLMTYSTRMIFNPEKEAQMERVNTAIKAMQEDGTLDQLNRQWISDLPVGQEPPGGAIKVIEGAETVKVGISGDAPPLDYIAADGQPGGFNIAVLNEISRRANLNIKLVKVSAGARFSALQSGKIDSFLWHNTNQNFGSAGSGQSGAEKSFLMSDPYLNSRGSLLVIK